MLPAWPPQHVGPLKVHRRQKQTIKKRKSVWLQFKMFDFLTQLKMYLWEHVHVYTIHQQKAPTWGTMSVWVLKNPWMVCFLYSPHYLNSSCHHKERLCDGVSSDAWPITLVTSMAAVKRLIYATWSLIQCLSKLCPFTVILLTLSPLPNGLAHQIPNDVLDKWSISWQLQHLSPWQGRP